jgi:hypothetical protein
MLGPNTNEWRRYHRCKGHDTERCYKLRDLNEELIRSGHIRKFIEKAAQGRTGRSGSTKQPRSPPPEGDKEKEITRIAVNTIAGRFAGGGESSSARKRYLRRIERETHSANHVTFPPAPDLSFSPKDARGVVPHDDDPLVIQVQILRRYHDSYHVQEKSLFASSQH